MMPQSEKTFDNRSMCAPWADTQVRSCRGLGEVAKRQFANRPNLPGAFPRNPYVPLSLCQAAAAGGAPAGGAAVAVVPQADGPGGQGGQIEILNGLG
jgi:hypothetical protein